MKKKTLAIALVCILLIAGIVGVTFAWLTANTSPIVNTFMPSSIFVELKENTGENYKMIPGETVAKDPYTKVLKGSEDCWLFVKIEKSENFDDFMTYKIADGWTAGNGTGEGKNGVPEGVYFRRVTGVLEANSEEFPILKDNEVAIKTSVTKEMMDELTTETYPTLTFTAYATQLYKSNNVAFTAAEAWAEVKA